MLKYELLFACALFINNVIHKDGGYDLEPKWAPGPYERQSAVHATPFAGTPCLAYADVC